MRLAEILILQAEVCRIPDAIRLVKASLNHSNRRLVVIDDDPTGTQTVHSTRVYLNWSVNILREALTASERVFFVSTNSRSLNADQAKSLGLEVGRNLREAAQSEGVELIVASRSDSTLRGHFPDEVDALASGMHMKYDGVIIVPAFFEGGRYTIDDIQWVEQGGEIVPAHETEFARDPVFGYKHSNLKDWVMEKSRGRVESKDVRSISLKLLREGGPEAVARTLSGIFNVTPVIANAACYEDLEVLALGILSAESRGKRFIYRCASSFVRVLGGIEERELLTHNEMVIGKGPGLIVIGSYVEKTSRQLDRLLASGQAHGIELRVELLEKEESRINEIYSVSQSVNEQLSKNITTVLYTSRKVNALSRTFLETGKIIIDALCEVVRHIQYQPNYVVAKGGITSIELARTGLNIEQSIILGQIIKGVPVWRPGAGARWPDIPYVVFPGNVGDELALSKVVEILEGN